MEPIRQMTGVQGEAYTAPWATRDDGPGHPAIDPSPPFVLMFHPQRWAIMAGKLIPGLAKLPLVDGSARVHFDRDGNIHFADARADLEKRGWRVVPEQWGPGGSYCRKVKTLPRGSLTPRDAFISFSETAYPGDPKTHSNDQVYATWAESLVTSGRLPRCSPHIAERLLAQARTEMMDVAQRQSKQPTGAGAVELDALTTKIAVLEAAIEAVPVDRGPPAATEVASSGVDTGA